MRGLSGAALEVVKTGTGVAAQAEYMQVLGDKVCPKVHWIRKGGGEAYGMELLSPAPQNDATLLRMKYLLQEHVWTRSYTMYEYTTTWQQNLSGWAADTFGLDMLRPAINSLISKGLTLYWRMSSTCVRTHGDPTLSNALCTREGALRIGDPIAPASKVPPFREVDMGKLLQSACGWDAPLRALNIGELWTSRILDNEDENFKCKSIFWCGIHLLRAIPYMTKAGASTEAIHAGVRDVVENLNARDI